MNLHRYIATEDELISLKEGFITNLYIPLDDQPADGWRIMYADRPSKGSYQLCDKDENEKAFALSPYRKGDILYFAEEWASYYNNHDEPANSILWRDVGLLTGLNPGIQVTKRGASTMDISLSRYSLRVTNSELFVSSVTVKDTSVSKDFKLQHKWYWWVTLC